MALMEGVVGSLEFYLQRESFKVRFCGHFPKFRVSKALFGCDGPIPLDDHFCCENGLSPL